EARDRLPEASKVHGPVHRYLHLQGRSYSGDRYSRHPGGLRVQHGHRHKGVRAGQGPGIEGDRVRHVHDPGALRSEPQRHHGIHDKFNDWYSNAHMPQALKIPGMVSGQRFRLAKEQREGANPQWQYMAYYEVETDDLQGVIDEMKRREGTPALVPTDTISPGG